MYARQITSEETYTLSEARKIISIERKEKRECLLQKATQKIVGLLAIGVSVTEIIATYTNVIEEGGISLIMLPVGIYLLVCRKNII